MFDCLDVERMSGFDWDEGNIQKNKLKHGLDFWLIEEIFFNEPLLIYGVIAPFRAQSADAMRWERPMTGQLLFVAFTVRAQNIRVISARPMSKKEKNYYEKNA